MVLKDSVKYLSYSIFYGLIKLGFSSPFFAFINV